MTPHALGRTDGRRRAESPSTSGVTAARSPRPVSTTTPTRRLANAAACGRPYADSRGAATRQTAVSCPDNAKTLALRAFARQATTMEGAAHGHDHHVRRHGDLLQGLGVGPTDRLQPWLASVGRRVGHPTAVLPPARLPRDRARPARARTLDPDRRR